MKKSFLTKAVVSTSAVGLALTMCCSAYTGLNVYNSSSTSFSEKVNADSHTIVIQTLDNPFNTSTNMVLNSDYYTDAYGCTAAAYYGCGAWSSAVPYRFARVRAYNGSTVIDSNYNFKDVSEGTVVTNLHGFPLTSKLSEVFFEGKCTVYNNIYNLQGENLLTCSLELEHT